MNSVLVKNFDSNAKGHLNTSLKNVRRFVSNKRKARKNMPERKPLITADTDSNSDEEITLHDIRDLKKVSADGNQSSCLRKINKADVNKSNGTVSENKQICDPYRNCDFLYLQIEEGDTLQSISVKYQCPVSDIKRANKLMSSQEFYGLKYLKIPVKKHSLLTEILPASVEAEPLQSTLLEEHDPTVRTINIGIGAAGRCPSPQDSAAFFKRMDEDLVKIMLSTNSQKDSLEAAAVALTAPQIHPLVKDPYNTVDCGIQWNYLILFVIILAIVVPAVVALYMYVRSSHENHPDVYPTDASPESYDSVSKLKSPS